MARKIPDITDAICSTYLYISSHTRRITHTHAHTQTHTQRPDIKLSTAHRMPSTDTRAARGSCLSIPQFPHPHECPIPPKVSSSHISALLTICGSHSETNVFVSSAIHQRMTGHFVPSLPICYGALRREMDVLRRWAAGGRPQERSGEGPRLSRKRLHILLRGPRMTLLRRTSGVLRAAADRRSSPGDASITVRPTSRQST